MRNSAWVGMIGTFVLCVLPAQAQDWSRLTRLKQGALIEVHSVGAPPGFNDRCRLEAVSVSTLSCTWEGDRLTRLVFPAAQVAAVFQVRHPGEGTSPWVGLAGIGIMIAGLASANLGLMLIGGVIACIALSVSSSAPPPPERLKLVYLR